MSDLMKQDKEYAIWISELVERYRRGQIKASIAVNYEVQAYYWMLGRDIVARNAENTYGNRFYEKLSQDLVGELRHSQGFSPANLRYMKRFYELFPEDVGILPQVAEELQRSSADEILPQIADDLRSEPRPIIGRALFAIPWGHDVLARYALDSSSQPIGISEYELSKLIPDEFKGSLPTIEEIEEELEGISGGLEWTSSCNNLTAV